jgi:hypothetical protein
MSMQDARAAGIIENFSYTNGGLIAASGNACKSWGGGGDATIVNGAARYEATTGNTNYGSGIALGFHYLTGASGMSTIQIAEGSGMPKPDNGGNNIVQVGAMSAGVTHTISVSLARGATNTSYSLYQDNVLLRSSTFVVNDDRAIGGSHWAFDKNLTFP